MMASTKASGESEKPLSHWGRRFLQAVLGLALALVVLNLVALQLARVALQRAEERVVAEGSSLDPQDVLPKAGAPAENAHDALEAARQILKADDKKLYRRLHVRLQVEILTGGERPTEEDLELFRRAVDHYGPVLHILDAALAIERAHFDFDPKVPTFEQLPYLNATESFADLLCARAHIALAESRPADAWRDVRAMFRLAGWSSQEMPILVSQLMAFTAVRVATLEARALLRRAVPDRDEMNLVLAEARRWDLQATFDVALEMERAEMVTWLLDGSWRERLLRDRFPPWLLSPPLRPWLYWNLAFYSDAITKLSAECRKPGYERARVVGQEGRLEELYPVPRWATLARSLASENHFDACNKRDMTAVYVDQMEIAFRLEDYRRRHGTYPSSLDALAGIPTVDPFSGRPYMYRLTDKGAMVYSVGINRTDENGTPPPIRKNVALDRYAGDLVWHLGS